MTRFAVLALALAACAAPAYGNACTAAATGNWSAAGTWASCGGTHPGAADTVAIAAGATITCDLAICTSAAMTATSPGTFIIATGSTWEPTANATLGTSADKYNLTFQAGSGLNCMPAASANVVLTVGLAFQFPSLLTVAGTSGSHVTLTTTSASGATCSFAQGQVSGLSLDWQYGDFSNFSNASNQMIPTLGLGGGGATDIFRQKHNTFTSCGSIAMGGDTVDPASIIDVENNTWISSTGTFNLRTYYSGTPTGTRIYANNVSDAQLALWYPRGWTFTNNVLNCAPAATLASCLFMFDDTDFILPTTFSGNFIGKGTQVAQAAIIYGSGTIGANFWWTNDSNDPHIIQNSGSATTSTVTGNIFQNSSALVTGTDEGVFFLSSGATVTLTENIVLADGSGTRSSGRLFGAPIGNSASHVTATNNTAFGSASDKASFVEVGEDGNSFAGQVVSMKYNIVWGLGTGWFGQDIGTVKATDAMAATASDYNNGYNLSTGTVTSNGSGTPAYGYNGFVFSTGAPGVHNKTVNPQFVDATRNLSKWDLSVGGPGTDADAITRLSANTALTASSLMPYVTAGFAPQNAAVCNMDGLGTPAGAVPCALPAAGAVVCLGFCAVQRVP